MSSTEDAKKQIVESLYETLATGDTEAAAGLLASDLEWWFHGPPRRQHMMKVLTGQPGALADFNFVPQRVAVVGDWVVAEGEEEWEYWVHVWTVKDGVITQIREYVNTWLTVRELGLAGSGLIGRCGPTVWQSEPRKCLGLSLPELVLAI